LRDGSGSAIKPAMQSPRAIAISRSAAFAAETVRALSSTLLLLIGDRRAR